MLIKEKCIFRQLRQLLLDRTEPYHSPAVHELVMDVDGVVVDGEWWWYRSGGYVARD